MNEYKNAQRLKSSELIGTGHIAVETHTSSAYPLHWHNYFEIEIVLSGSGKHICNGTEYDIQKGDAYLLTPIDFHEIKAVEPVKLINISFDEVCLPESMLAFLSQPKSERMYRFNDGEFDRFVATAELLRYECESDGPCALLLEYLLSLFARHEHQTSFPVSREHLQGIKKAIAYIEVHFREPITLEQLAALSGYHPTYFSELFRNVTGQTYMERLRDLRVGYAQMLLSNGLSVSDACFASGFGSLSNFLSAFKAKCHMTPSEYRKSRH